MRALRPDGICYKAICGTEAWREYVSSRTVPFSESFEGAGPIIPIFFVLSPGMGPLKESLGKKLGYTVRTPQYITGARPGGDCRGSNGASLQGEALGVSTEYSLGQTLAADTVKKI